MTNKSGGGGHANFLHVPFAAPVKHMSVCVCVRGGSWQRGGGLGELERFPLIVPAISRLASHQKISKFGFKLPKFQI